MFVFQQLYFFKEILENGKHLICCIKKDFITYSGRRSCSF